VSRYRSPFTYRDEASSATGALYIALGALAGFAAGVVVAQHYGGIGGLSHRIRQKLGRADHGAISDEDSYDDAAEFDVDDDHHRPLTPTEELEERVLEAFRNDPILSERAIDIGAIEQGIIELTGWVNAEDETDQAVVIARGVPGVDTVVNRLAVRSEEDLYDDLADRYEEGDPSLTESHWEGQGVGTGRRRQGNSSEPDRHEDPKQPLEEKALDKDYLDAGEESEVKAERRQRATKRATRAGRTDGSPITPTGVPKADHVADPLDTPESNPPQ
jgi:hypothetical protein